MEDMIAKKLCYYQLTERQRSGWPRYHKMDMLMRL